MGIAYNPSIVTSGLVLCLDAANPKSYPGSGTTWTDLSGNGNNGTLTNGPTYSSANGGGIVFDGVDDFVTIPSSNSYKVQFPVTVGLFVRLASITGYAMLFLADNTSDAHRGFSLVGSLYNSGYRISSQFGNGTANGPSGRRTYLTTTELNFNNWYYCVAVFPDALTSQIYVNGSPITTTYDTGTGSTMVYSTGNAIIGSRTDGTLRYLNGNIAQVSIYNRALTAAEISQNFQATRGRYGI